MPEVDLSAFQGGQKSLLQMQQLQAAFEQAQTLQALQSAALVKQVTAPAIGPLDLLKLQVSQQEHGDALDVRKDALAQQFQIAQMAQQGKQDALGQKQDLRMSNDQNSLAAALAANNDQLQRANSVLQAPGIESNFGMMGAIPARPGSESSDAKAALEQLNANAFMGALGNLKAQSRTGASGLGALSEREGDKVQAAAAALQKTQSFDSFKQNLEKYKSEIQASNDRLTSGFNNIYGQKAPQAIPSEGIHVSNPKTGESYVVQPNDLQAALSEGFVKQ